MTGANHAITGGVIGLAIGNPLAIPVAFASHFLFDALPHMGMEDEERIRNRKMMLIGIAVDIVLIAVVYGAAIVNAVPWYVFASMIAAMSPDFVWIYRFIFEENMGKTEPGPLSGLNKWHIEIQTHMGLSGVFIEVFWFVLMWVIAANLI